ncbi:MBOAT family O-acyltransferase [Mangrovimonas xylaniphaga]|uniref:MBOAT family O-acyltransferase n=1 Tax=Mangrovimonas xylaniphaga TaxID=1645915 RepID=UPI000A981742|nr:MBOAT family O-acyltransferase [Mangrovimonas xylaniphaga]
MNLSDYVKRRNGVPIGASNSLRNMLSRSLGAGTFSRFWHYWNPIWRYYLGKYIFKPLKSIAPSSLSLLITFVVCGFIHDLAIMLLKWKFTLLLTPWFLFMGLSLILSDYLKINYSKFPWAVRAAINLTIISGCLLVAYQLRIGK